MANPGKQLYKLVKTDGSGDAAGDLIVQIGNDVFASDTTTTAKSVTTDLDTIVGSFVNYAGVTSDEQDMEICGPANGAVSSDAVTFTRITGGTSAAAFSYLLFGRKSS